MSIMQKVLVINGMTCTACESRVERTVLKINGVVSADVSYATGRATISYHSEQTSIEEITTAIEKVHYEVEAVLDSSEKNQKNKSKALNKTDQLTGLQYFAIAAIVLGATLFLRNRINFAFLPEISQDMGYVVLFVVGLVTSLHCIAMCGGINLSQSLPRSETEIELSKLERLKPSLMYNAGRVVSYTIIGGLVGAIGAVISVGDNGKAFISLFAGAFMIIMGLNLLNVFPSLRKLNPRMPKSVANKVHDGSRNRAPFVVGLINGFMPCGPLQAMQLYALGTGSFVAGALSMFMFSLGTVPFMLGLGAISTVMTRKTMKKMMAGGAMLVIILGLSMFSRGLTLSGFALPNILGVEETSYVNPATVEGDVQYVTTYLESGAYAPITVEVGVPVEWTIVASEETLNGCNNALSIPEYGVEKALEPGDNVITFTPTETGTFGYSCWMGMITSEIIVVEDLEGNESDDNSVSAAEISDSSSSDMQSSSDQQVSSDSSSSTTQQIEMINPATIEGDVQKVTTTLTDGIYQPITVQVGIPVEWTIQAEAEELTSCNYRIEIPQYGVQTELQPGATVVTFTPTETGSFKYSCWMGMLSSQIVVVEDLETSEVTNEDYYPPGTKSRNSGGCGCCG